jgi:hypothetical protein
MECDWPKATVCQTSKCNHVKCALRTQRRKKKTKFSQNNLIKSTEWAQIIFWIPKIYSEAIKLHKSEHLDIKLQLSKVYFTA